MKVSEAPKKFRAWNIRDRQWHHFNLPSQIKDVAKRSLEYQWWCQYIGMKDVEGTEIYEGDCVRINRDHGLLPYHGIIEYEDGEFVFTVRDDREITRHRLRYADMASAMVVGDVFSENGGEI